MSKRILLIALLALLLALTAACTNKKSQNPLAGIGSKQPDKVLFDKAMDAMHHNRFDVSRMTLQVLINTYPDSEYIARAKLAEGDSWYAEGGTAALAQAEQVYDDFKTFFPNMPEAAEAQLKIANIHYQQMEKADRDYTHAKRAEEEYRNMILQFPDSKLVPEAKERLLEVQQVLGEREFQIGRFYYLRESYPASMARLKSLVEKYPLYSRADEALYLLGQNYEGQIARLKTTPTCDVHGLPRGCTPEAAKTKYIESLTKSAAEAYDQILTRYPVMDRADDAKKRLTALHQPVPRPTRAAVAQNKAEESSRHDSTTLEKFMRVIKKTPDTSQASKVGEPTLVDPTPVSSNDVVQQETIAAIKASRNDNDVVGVKILNPEQPASTETAPPPDAAPSGGSPFGQPRAANTQPPSTAANELTPNADPNELKPVDTGVDPTLPPPPQVNELAGQSSASPASPATASADATPASDKEISESRKKKKKGLKKLNPF
jgi:outer membrane protein assembly factor BamD